MREYPPPRDLSRDTFIWNLPVLTFKHKSTSVNLQIYLHIELYLTFCEPVVYLLLYNNQINARALIGQSAMVYCASKPMENSYVLRIII